MSRAGVVVIGRNEGARLERSLRSIRAATGSPLVYVDSRSSDGSVAFARSVGAEVVLLEEGPTSAARARNAGCARLLQLQAVEFVLFVDGDCSLQPGFLEQALGLMDQRPELAVVCGRRRELFRERSIYNLLCDLEWDTPVGDALACGGDALIRARAFEQAGGYDSAMLAGEDPKLCVRLRLLGFRIARIDAEMTLHDAAIGSFGQWWRRTRRSGLAWAALARKHHALPERTAVRPLVSALFYGALLPLVVLALAWPTHGLSLWLLLVYLGLVLRIAARRLRASEPRRESLAYALFTVLGKFAEAEGALRFFASARRGPDGAAFDYKRPGAR